MIWQRLNRNPSSVWRWEEYIDDYIVSICGSGYYIGCNGRRAEHSQLIIRGVNKVKKEIYELGIKGRTLRDAG